MSRTPVQDLRKMPPVVRPAEADAADMRAPATEEQPPLSERSKELHPQSASTRLAEPFRLRPGPILVAVVLVLAFSFLPSLVVDTLSDFVRLPVHGAKLPFFFAEHTVMLLLAVAAISFLQRYSHADFGLHRPHGRSYIGTAIVLSFLIGIVMAVVDYAPFLFGRIAPPLDYPFSGLNIFGWMIFQGVYSGPTEEIPFRALLVTYLATAMPGKVHYRGITMNGGGVTAAAIFAIGAGLTAFIASPFFLALAQVSYVFVFGVCLAYWLEKSNSVWAPAIGHNVAFGVRQALIFAMVAAWR
jgi:hypothetical protein